MTRECTHFLDSLYAVRLLAGQLFSQLVGWLAGCLVGLLVAWFVRSFVRCSAGWLVAWQLVAFLAPGFYVPVNRLPATGNHSYSVAGQNVTVTKA